MGASFFKGQKSGCSSGAGRRFTYRSSSNPQRAQEVAAVHVLGDSGVETRAAEQDGVVPVRKAPHQPFHVVRQRGSVFEIVERAVVIDLRFDRHTHCARRRPDHLRRHGQHVVAHAVAQDHRKGNRFFIHEIPPLTGA